MLWKEIPPQPQEQGKRRGRPGGSLGGKKNSILKRHSPSQHYIKNKKPTEIGTPVNPMVQTGPLRLTIKLNIPERVHRSNIKPQR